MYSTKFFPFFAFKLHVSLKESKFIIKNDEETQQHTNIHSMNINVV